MTNEAKRIIELARKLSPLEPERTIVFLFHASDSKADQHIRSLGEGRQYQELGQGWKLAWDSAHVHPGEDHVHVYLNGDKLYAVNKSGKGHDGSSGQTIHKKPLIAIQKRWPNISKLIESVNPGTQLIPPDIMQCACSASIR